MIDNSQPLTITVERYYGQWVAAARNPDGVIWVMQQRDTRREARAALVAELAARGFTT